MRKFNIALSATVLLFVLLLFCFSGTEMCTIPEKAFPDTPVTETGAVSDTGAVTPDTDVTDTLASGTGIIPENTDGTDTKASDTCIITENTDGTDTPASDTEITSPDTDGTDTVTSDTDTIPADTDGKCSGTAETPPSDTVITEDSELTDEENEAPVTSVISAETRTQESPSEDDINKNSEAKVLVGISGTDDNSQLANYESAVKLAGCDALILPYVSTADEASVLLDGIDALVMTGGEDIDPAWYGENVLNSSIEINAARDTSDILLMREAIRRDMPVLCICRGMQILNVVCGGTLYQDIPAQVASALTHRDSFRHSFIYHTVQTENDSLVRTVLGSENYVNSWHHQAVNKAGENIRITARSADGIVEAIELTGKKFIVGVQFHPEYHIAKGNKTFLQFFTALADAAS